MKSRLGGVRLVVVGAFAAMLIVPSALARQSTSLTLDVTFFASGQISVALPDGTPVGTTSGAPTVIPAGVYTMSVLGPGGCTQLPLFDLSGPGVRVQDDMIGGEVTSEAHVITLQPNSTYTWRTDNDSASPTHTFVTNSQVLGTAPVQTTTGPTSTTPSSQDIVGSGIVPFRGTLTGAVSASGKLTLSFKGKSVTQLTAGRYAFKITDRSSSRGFQLRKSRKSLTLTAPRFVGTHTTRVDLTAGKWLFTPSGGKPAFSIAVSA
ncbi:MAG TPA: hypothetical protein VH063_16595 [Gaiellaceae bacterium]|nr:hypothetical protein [Gaiellaceae bacterium]